MFDVMQVRREDPAQPAPQDNAFCLRITHKGKYHRIDLTQDQQTQHLALRASLLTGYDLNHTLNIDEGTIRENGPKGKILKTIPSDDKDLAKIRKLALQGLKIDPDNDAFAASRWPSYKVDSLPLRASEFARLPLFRKELMKGMKFKDKHLTEAREKYGVQGGDRAEIDRRFKHAKALPEKLKKHLKEQIEVLRKLNTAAGNERAEKLEGLEKELDLISSAVLQFAALYPLPRALPDPMDRDFDRDDFTRALGAQKQVAQEVLKKFYGSPKEGSAKQKKLDILASELALLSCRTREQFKIGSEHFGLFKTGNILELYLIDIINGRGAQNFCTFTRIHSEDVAGIQLAAQA